jgi:hypothetical protein
LGEKDASELIGAGIRKFFRKGTVLTPDLGGSASTRQVGTTIAAYVKEGQLLDVALPAPLRSVMIKAIWKQKPPLVQRAHGLLGVNHLSLPYE